MKLLSIWWIWSQSRLMSWESTFQWMQWGTVKSSSKSNSNQTENIAGTRRVCHRYRFIHSWIESSWWVIDWCWNEIHNQAFIEMLLSLSCLKSNGWFTSVFRVYFCTKLEELGFIWNSGTTFQRLFQWLFRWLYRDLILDSFLSFLATVGFNLPIGHIPFRPLALIHHPIHLIKVVPISWIIHNWALNLNC